MEQWQSGMLNRFYLGCMRAREGSGALIINIRNFQKLIGMSLDDLLQLQSERFKAEA